MAKVEERMNLREAINNNPNIPRFKARNGKIVIDPNNKKHLKWFEEFKKGEYYAK